ncbi:MAG: c-type cytochrome domain-containing protein, partial [Pseudomonadota bacterium]
MKTRYLPYKAAVLALALLGVTGVLQAAAPEDHFKLLDEYCSQCHNATDWAGGVAFDTMTPDGIPDEAKVWEEAVRKMRGRLMPPPGE